MKSGRKWRAEKATEDAETKLKHKEIMSALEEDDNALVGRSMFGGHL